MTIISIVCARSSSRPNLWLLSRQSYSRRYNKIIQCWIYFVKNILCLVTTVGTRRYSIIETTLIHRRDVLSTSRWRCVFARYRVIKNTWVKSQQNRNQYKQLKKTGRLDTGYRYSKHENMNMNTRIKDLLFHTGNPSYWMQTLK